jgi:hypothetical protein
MTTLHRATPWAQREARSPGIPKANYVPPTLIPNLGNINSIDASNTIPGVTRVMHR